MREQQPDRRGTVTDLVLLGTATTGFLIACIVVDRSGVTQWEIDTTEWVNRAPNAVIIALWPVMQLGSVWSPIVLGAASTYFYGRRRGVAVFVSGVSAWYLAKLVKDVVGRGRPHDYLPDIKVHEHASGEGFVSGHSAVAFAIATALLPVLPRRGRIAAYLLASAVTVARVANGVHFPLDVVGGACLGVMCGAVTDIAVTKVRMPKVRKSF